MPEKQENIQERRGRTSSLVNNMLDERKQLLSLLLQLSDLDADNAVPPALETLDEFCQVLMDYIAAGHFGLYERIAEGTERRKGVSELAIKVYPSIEHSTQIAVAFNEKYQPGEATLGDIHQDLSKLGEELTNRIELEDQLIQELSGRSDLAPVV